jgi:hypothetical protein
MLCTALDNASCFHSLVTLFLVPCKEEWFNGAGLVRCYDATVTLLPSGRPSHCRDLVTKIQVNVTWLSPTSR